MVEQQQKLSQVLFSAVKPEPLLRHLHMNLSPPLNQGLTYRMFTDDEDNVLLKEKLKSLSFRQTPLDVQLALPVGNCPNLYSSLTAQLYGSREFHFDGYCRISSFLHAQLITYGPLLRQWLRLGCGEAGRSDGTILAPNEPDELPVEVMGVRLSCNPATRSRDETCQLDALKVISGLRHEGVKKMSDGDRLLLDYELKVRVDGEPSYVRLV